jgi:phosphoribosylaminoimidazolecarboxamide formyltransferase / IMP cyclohydrolase
MLRPIRRALLSVSDKAGLVDFARVLVGFGATLISTGGTKKALADAGLAVLDVSDVTDFPEMLDGRVKTLHPRIHAGILARREDPKHVATLAEHQIDTIDLVVCNLYPFEATLARPGSTHEEIVENIDIGGPSMIRAACKNYEDVAVVVGPLQYEAVAAELTAAKGSLSLETRERLAGEAFEATAAYDAAIAGYFAKRRTGADWPERLTLSWKKRSSLRYGENPHQKAAFYVEPIAGGASLATAEILHGKELSYNNLLDLDAALGLVREFSTPAAVVIKHGNPCGAAVAANLALAFVKAYEGDPTSAFGGILAFNREVDDKTATQITEPGRFIECILAPSFSPAAFEIITTRPTWKKNVRVLKTGPLTAGGGVDYRRIDGGLLVQSRDQGSADFANLQVKTKRPPTAAERADLEFAWAVAKHVKSNAIVLAKDAALVGVGAGQMSRVDSTQIAIKKAGNRAKGSVLASDAFFPFRDNVDSAAMAGITALIQPGGSVRDQESVDACDEHGLAMVFTGVRHFRH